jgi:hypothetical protein
MLEFSTFQDDCKGLHESKFLDISELALNLVDLSTFITHGTTVQGLA